MKSTKSYKINSYLRPSRYRNPSFTLKSKRGVTPFSHHSLVMSFQSHRYTNITIQTEHMEDDGLLSET